MILNRFQSVYCTETPEVGETAVSNDVKYDGVPVRDVEVG